MVRAHQVGKASDQDGIIKLRNPQLQPHCIELPGCFRIARADPLQVFEREEPGAETRPWSFRYAEPPLVQRFGHHAPQAEPGKSERYAAWAFSTNTRSVQSTEICARSERPSFASGCVV